MIVGNIIIITTLIGITAISSPHYHVPDYVSVTIVSLFILGFSVASGPITSLYTSDILPDSGIAFAVG